MGLPDPNGSTWYADTAVGRRERERLNFDFDADACVVGGGLAGLTVARELARRGWSVALLEADRIAWNASGRNAGFVLPGFSQPPEAIVARVGKKRAQALWQLSVGGVEYVRRTIAETGMPGTEPVDGWLQVSKSDRKTEIVDEAELLRGEFGADVETWPTDLVRTKLKSLHYFQAIHYPTAFHIHPLNYAMGLAQAAEAAGVRIFEQSRVSAIDAAGVRKRVTTAQARVRSSQIVLAGNAHLGDLMPTLSATLVPISTYVMTTEPLGEKIYEAIDYRGAVSDSRAADNHYRVLPDGRLMWSGRLTAWAGDPARYVEGLKSDIRQTFPQLGEIAVSHAWTGTMGRPVHGMPQIGQLSPGLWLLSGFGGHGLNTTAMAGEIVARAIAEGDETWKQFRPYELIWAGGAMGRAAIQAGYWATRFADNRAAKRSRQRERRHHEAAEQARRQAADLARRAADAEIEARAKAASQEAADAIRRSAETETEKETESQAATAPAVEPQVNRPPVRKRQRRKKSRQSAGSS